MELFDFSRGINWDSYNDLSLSVLGFFDYLDYLFDYRCGRGLNHDHRWLSKLVIFLMPLNGFRNDWFGRFLNHDLDFFHLFFALCLLRARLGCRGSKT